MKLNIVWTRDCKTEKEKTERETLLLNSQLAFRVLKNVATLELETLEREEVQLSSFDNPNWGYAEAFKLGRKNQLRKLLDLVSFV